MSPKLKNINSLRTCRIAKISANGLESLSLRAFSIQGNGSQSASGDSVAEGGLGSAGWGASPDAQPLGFTHRATLWSGFPQWIVTGPALLCPTRTHTPARARTHTQARAHTYVGTHACAHTPGQHRGPAGVPLSGMSSLQGKAKGVMEC